jgi:PAS domain S-box-containing protein
MSLNREVKRQLAEAFGLKAESDVDALLASLRDDEDVDPRIVRKGCRALLESLLESRTAKEESDERLQLAHSASGLGFWVWNVAAGTVFFDDILCGMLGLEVGELRPSKNLAAWMHADDRADFHRATVQALKGEVPLFHVKHRVRHTAGYWIWLETYGRVSERDAAGRATRMTCTHIDITERVNLEHALANNLQVLQQLLETLPLPVIMRDAERRVTMVNAALEKMFGVSRETLVGKRPDDLVTPAHPPGPGSIDGEDSSELAPSRYEATWQTPAGETYDVIVAKTPLIAADGTVTGHAAVFTDISEQKRTAADLERARLAAEAAVRAKSRFLANMSHELRTPLNGVVGMASLLESTGLDAKQRQFVRTLRSSAESLVTLINDVLDLSKVEAGKLTLARTQFEVRHEIEQVVNLFSARAYEKNIELAAHVAREVPKSMLGDPVRVRQVLGNLVSNAIKFTESGAVLLAVTAATTQDGKQQVEFSVNDTGVGVAADEQARIFEAFEQADDSTTRKFGGTGLGLAISRQLVELMHGSIGLESEPGRGSRFFFRLPVGALPAVTAASSPANDLGIILIGMHPMITRAVFESLAAESAQVITVDSPGSAIEALGKLAAGIRRVRVIVDASSTNRLREAVDGLRIAAAPRSVEIVVLVPPNSDSVQTAGVNRCIIKPLLTHDLLSAPAPTPADAAPGVSREAVARGSRGRALLVEDNAVNQEMTRAMLEVLGFDVTIAANGREGVAAATADPELDVILMDCQMPVMDGLSAAQAVRAHEAGDRRVPILALTGNARPDDIKACLSAGMDDCLVKPFSLMALRTLLDRWAAAPIVSDEPASTRLRNRASD